MHSGLLLLTEVQSRTDCMAPVYFCQYLCNQSCSWHIRPSGSGMIALCLDRHDFTAPVLVWRLEALQDRDFKERLLSFISLTLQDVNPRLSLQAPRTTQELEEMVEACRMWRIV